MGKNREAALSGVIKGKDVPAPRGPRCKRCYRPIRDHDHAPYCCLECREAEGEEYSQARLRALVLERDKGFCCECGTLCVALRAELDELKHQALMWPTFGLRVYEARVFQLVRLGFPRKDVEEGRTLWDTAHVKDRVRGGPNTLANVVTKCLACHGKETKAFAKARAQARKPKKWGRR